MITLNTSFLGTKHAAPLLVAVIGIAFGAPDAMLAATPTRQEYTNSMVRKWTAMFGNVAFTDEHLFRCMQYVQPQPEVAFRPFSTEVLSRVYPLEFRDAIGEFFKAPLHDALRDLKPSKYYLNEGRIEPSLFRYDFELEGHRVVMLENFNAFFLTITPPDFSSNSPVSRQLVSDLLYKWINVREESRDELVQKLNLPTQLRTGDVFSNRRQTEPLLMRSGRDHVVGFISKEGICLIVFKAQEGRAAMGLPVQLNWVNQQMFEADGTTRFDHPKYFMQSPQAEKPPKP